MCTLLFSFYDFIDEENDVEKNGKTASTGE